VVAPIGDPRLSRRPLRTIAFRCPTGGTTFRKPLQRVTRLSVPRRMIDPVIELEIEIRHVRQRFVINDFNRLGEEKINPALAFSPRLATSHA